jgi:hypothetical protein
MRCRAGLEPLEEKRLLSAGHVLDVTGAASIASEQQRAFRPARYTVFRVTNPTPFNAILKPPFAQVRVQATPPEPGQEYNLLFITMRNGTRQTFDANSGLFVRATGQVHAFPILTGNELWKPNQVMVFYLFSKQYYPLSPITGAGFEFNLNGSQGTAIPGPSGIFLRLTYNPATFPKTLNWIVAHGPGSKGHHLGLPDTSIWEFTSAKNYMVPL